MKTVEPMSPQLAAAAYRYALDVIANQCAESEQSRKLITLAKDALEYFPATGLHADRFANMAKYVAEHFPAKVAND